MCSVTAQGSVYSQFKRALKRQNFLVVWTIAAELPKVQLGDALALLLLARDVEAARFDRAAPRWHARLCTERQLSAGEAQLALAALNALPRTSLRERGALPRRRLRAPRPRYRGTRHPGLASLTPAHGLAKRVEPRQPERPSVWQGGAPRRGSKRAT
jgi:hypothetical protein